MISGLDCAIDVIEQEGRATGQSSAAKNTSDSLGSRKTLTIPGSPIARTSSAKLHQSLIGREARTTTAEAEKRSFAVRAILCSLQELLQDDIRSSGGGTRTDPPGESLQCTPLE